MDAEEVRELLSTYFAQCRVVIGRYGGVVEKFIGDAVMAVWGVPVAHEDDAERAVRAGLELVATVAAMGQEVGAQGLALRVGVVTGEVAVTVGATAEGMVAGDAVNTAARVQGAAEPGRVWVDETTRGLSSAAITFTDTGEHALKGKSEPMRLWEAGVVVARRRRRAAGRRAGGPVDRARLRAADDQGALPRHRGVAPSPAGRPGRRGRDRQVADVLGVREVRRRADRSELVAQRSLPVLRRRHRLLGAQRGDPGPVRAGRVGHRRGGARAPRRRAGRVRGRPGRA